MVLSLAGQIDESESVIVAAVLNAGLRRGMHLPFRPLNNVLRCQIGRKIARHPSPTALEFNCEAVCNDV
jgi:hypothetical protein